MPTAVQKESPDNLRTRLARLEELGREMHDLWERSFIRHSDRQPEDSTLDARKQEIERIVRAHMPLLRDALQNSSHTKEALKVCDQLISTESFEEETAERIADAAPELQHFLMQYPDEIATVIRLMGEAHMSIRSRARGNPRVMRGADKIRIAIERAAPALEIYFSAANKPESREIVSRLRMLEHILTIDTS